MNPRSPKQSQCTRFKTGSCRPWSEVLASYAKIWTCLLMKLPQKIVLKLRRRRRDRTAQIARKIHYVRQFRRQDRKCSGRRRSSSTPSRRSQALHSWIAAADWLEVNLASMLSLTSSAGSTCWTSTITIHSGIQICNYDQHLLF